MQKPKPGYKLVKSLFGKYEEIPEDWEVKKLNEITNKIGDGIHSTPEYVEHSEYYFINGNNLINGKITYFENTKNVSKEEFLKYELKLNENTILLSINGTIGNVAFYNKEKIILGKSASYIICNDKLNTLFLFYQLQSNLTKKYFSTQLTGTTISNLSLSSIRNMIFHLPLFPEQQKIASILSNVDNLIDSTSKIIENSKSLKTGLMQKLLTRGIGHKKFKKVKWYFGKEIEIPEEWEIKKFEKIAEFLGGYAFSSNDYVENGIQLLRQGNLQNRELDLEKDPIFIPKSFELEYLKYVLKPRDIVVSLTGTMVKRDYGYAVLLPENSPISFLNQRMAKITSNEKIIPEFLRYLMNHSYFEDQFYRLEAGTKQANVSLNDVKKIKIFTPPIKEQQKITMIFENIDSNICELESKKTSLEKIKKGLMQKLLTGQIRVKV